MDSKNRRLRRLLAQPDIIPSFAPHDVFTARVLDDVGIELLFLGGFGVSASVLGLPDVGLTTLSEMTEAVRRMTDRISVPLIADGDTGHGNLNNVARTVREFERAGASGMLLEDQVSPKRCGHFAGKDVVSAEEMLGRLRAALDARDDPEFVIIARTDARAVEGFDAAVERANRYGEAGADVCFVEAPQSRDELQQLPKLIPFPQLANMLPGGVTPILSATELQEIGFRIVVDPVGTLAATAHVVRQLGEAMLTEGRVDHLAGKMSSFDEVKRILGLDKFLR
ncbi:MAG: isocitrate lyase/PEP mutase family protein [Planctomycetota bacterium]|nr:isocitrate lyase/PEP mutase family protein [Planctomycetota bacterium]MDA1248948.1 isocitrate lyase/PEP mutase family protein [Planctomycetota bacterium]